MTARRAPLGTAFESPEAKRQYVRRLFATIADRYDLITVLLSFGLDRRWKRRLVRLPAAAEGARALDLACGTGDIAFELAGRGARVVGLDVTPRMVQIASAKRRPKTSRAGSAGTRGGARLDGAPAAVAFLVGDMMALPFADGQFDVVTTGYGLRNVPDLARAAEEAARVLRPGGLLLSLDFNRPAGAVVRSIYLAYLTVVGSALGFALHRDPDTYRYIPESVRRYPGAPAVARLLERHGFAAAEWRPVLGGLMAIHVARK